MNRNIALIGLMGCGKTTVGKVLAKKTGLKYIDSDDFIVKKAKMPISEIFKTQGEPYFRDLEAQTIREISEMQGYIISTGGGAVIRPENLDNLKKSGVVIYLKASPLELYNRTKDDTSRPLLNVENPVNKLEALLEQRKPFYKTADITVDTEKKPIDDVVKEVLSYLD